jgi:hypothetical protein
MSISERRNGITSPSSSFTTSFRDSLAFKPLFLRNALHCVCLLGASPNSAVNASGLDEGGAVLRRSNVTLIAAERTGPLAKLSGHYPKIIEVFHAAVCHSQVDHGLDFSATTVSFE